MSAQREIREPPCHTGSPPRVSLRSPGLHAKDIYDEKDIYESASCVARMSAQREIRELPCDAASPHRVSLRSPGLHAKDIYNEKDIYERRRPLT
jgi:hypothetical protein